MDTSSSFTSVVSARRAGIVEMRDHYVAQLGQD